MTDQEFIAGMWQKVQKIKQDEQEIQNAKKRNRRLRNRTIVMALSVVLLFAPILFFTQLFGVSYAILGLIPLVGAFLIDGKIYTDQQEEKRHEQH